MGRPFNFSIAADYQSRYARRHSGIAPEPTPAFKGWCYDLLAALCGLMAVVSVWFLLWALS
jgi:hypothetical protein